MSTTNMNNITIIETPPSPADEEFGENGSPLLPMGDFVAMDTSSMKDSVDGGSTEAMPMKTVVAFVINEEEDEDSSSGGLDGGVDADAEERMNRKRASNSASVFLSIMYATLIVLIGIVFPVSEALLDSWKSDTAVAAVFMVYLLAGSTVILILLMIRNKKRPKIPTNIFRKPPTSPPNDPLANGDVFFGPGEDMVDNIPDNTLLSRRRSRSLSDLRDPSDVSGKPTTPEFPGFGGLTRTGSAPSLNALTANPHLRHLSSDASFSPSLQDVSNGTRLAPHSPNALTAGKRACSLSSIVSEVTSQGGHVTGNGSQSGSEVAHYISLTSRTASMSHEGTSLYLRFGCVVLSVAYLMYIILEMTYYFTALTSPCYPETQNNIYVLAFQLIFVLVQTFFLFKTENLHIKRYKRLVRFGLMHVLATNLVVWIRALVLEIVHGIHEAHGHGHGDEHHGSHHESEEDSYSEDSHEASHDSYEGTPTNCSSFHEHIAVKASVYLFPCILEYSLVASATMIIRFKALDIRVSTEVLKSIKTYLRKAKKQVIEGLRSDSAGRNHEHGHAKMLDKSHKGLYVGILAFTFTFVAFIMFIYFKSIGDKAKHQEAILIYDITDLCLCIAAFIAIVIGVWKMRKLSYSFLRDNYVDHILLLISFCGLTIYELFQVVCFIYNVNHGHVNSETVLGLIISLFTTIGALAQLAFIMFGMQLYSHSAEQRRAKPGRGMITFLILANLSFWVIKSFGEGDVSAELMETFFGVTAWQIILHFNLPFKLFFRFHSSVCLADMWTSAYENEESPIEYVDIN